MTNTPINPCSISGRCISKTNIVKKGVGKSVIYKKVISNIKLIIPGKNMPIFSISQRLKIALGGFTSFTGVIILICIVLALTNTADLSVALQGVNLVFILTIVGVLDIACGLILFLGRKEIISSFTSNQKKTGNNAD